MSFESYLTESTAKGLLTYPGGKKKVAKEYTTKYFPKTFNDFYEPFMGGCSVSLQVATDPDKKVFANDINKNLYTFWKVVKSDPVGLTKKLNRIRKTYDPDDIEKGRKLLKKMNNVLLKKDATDLNRAVYFVLNKISFSGMTENSSFSKYNYKNKFNLTNIKRIVEVSGNIKNIKFFNKDYKTILKKAGKDDFIYLDPPYELKKTHNKLYGRDGKLQSGFDHDKFFKTCDSIEVPWMISYNDTPEIRERFEGYNIKKKKHLYTLSHKKDEDGKLNNQTKTELIITNFNR